MKTGADGSKTVESTKKLDTTHALYGKKVVMTGFRDKALEERLKSMGVKVSSSVSGKTDFVVVPFDETTGKADKARDIGVKLITLEMFKKML